MVQGYGNFFLLFISLNFFSDFSSSYNFVYRTVFLASRPFVRADVSMGCDARPISFAILVTWAIFILNEM